jgi:hypothetical protein
MYSGKSIIRPEFFRDWRHDGLARVTNGITSRKSNSLHKWVPLQRHYNATRRMVTFSRSPHAVPCGSAEVGRMLAVPRCVRYARAAAQEKGPALPAPEL